MDAYFGQPGFAGNPNKIKVLHPLADEISLIFESPQQKHCEIAFFKNGEWVLETIKPFSEWAEPVAGNTRVYRWVPVEVIKRWLPCRMTL